MNKNVMSLELEIERVKTENELLKKQLQDICDMMEYAKQYTEQIQKNASRYDWLQHQNLINIDQIESITPADQEREGKVINFTRHDKVNELIDRKIAEKPKLYIKSKVGTVIKDAHVTREKIKII